MVFWNLFSVLLQGNLHPITHQNMTGFHSDHILTCNTINLILMWLYDVVKKFHIMGFQHCHPTFEFEWTLGKLLHLNIPWCISTYWKQICFEWNEWMSEIYLSMNAKQILSYSKWIVSFKFLSQKPLPHQSRCVTASFSQSNFKCWWRDRKSVV